MLAEAHIYSMTNGGIDTVRWLCAECVARRRSLGWTARSIGQARSCDQCEILKQGVVPLGCGSTLIPVTT